MKFMKRKSSDFIVQIFPGWILILLSSCCIVLFSPPYFTYQFVFKFIMFTSIGVCSVSFFLLFVIKNISLDKYNTIILKLKNNRNIN